LKISPPADADFLLSSYAFTLPEDRIAQYPAGERDASRLMVLERETGRICLAGFSDILRFLPEKCLLVANNSRVIPARMWGQRPGGGRVEILLLTPPPLLEALPDHGGPPGGMRGDCFVAEAEALLRPAKKIRPGDRVSISSGLDMELVEQGDFGRCRVLLHWQGDLQELLRRHGAMPLPPYIHRLKPQGGVCPDEVEGDSALDRERYQTTYARQDKAGSVAAPTAGLHFTPELRAALLASGREWVEATLYVGYGTFSPVRCRDIREHAMHAEYVELPAATAEAVNRARREGRQVIAVGTTSVRTLEGVFAAQRGQGGNDDALAAHAGWINIFLYPGRPFHVTDGLITNFHLPESSLLMLVSALAGRERILAAYARALAEGFRFFSYGDAMLIV